MTWCRLAPTAKPITNAATIPTNAGQVGIDGLDFITLDASLSNYTVTGHSNAAQGVLYYNSTGTTYAAVANNQTLTPAQAASLRFDPADGATGPAVFSYTVTDTNAPNAPTGSLNLSGSELHHSAEYANALRQHSYARLLNPAYHYAGRRLEKPRGAERGRRVRR